ncbi:MAG: polar amino acid transport system substrate-binding protein [Pseudohongiellaceae bacterium]|jgi:polar amino acid transport system substrate-binding protein
MTAENDLGNHQQIAHMLESLNWVTEEHPPFNYRDPITGEISGAAVEVLLQIFRKIGVASDRINLKIYPWARGYYKVLNDPGTVLFSTTYTPDRLAKMKFVGPMAPNVVAVIALKSRNLVINSHVDLNRLRIGVVRDDIGEQLLLSQGVETKAIDQLNSGLGMVKKLASGRIDAVAYPHAATQFLFKTASINSDDFEIIHVLKSSAMGYAFHSSTDEYILEPMREALRDLDLDGTLTKIQIKYGLKTTDE